MKYVWSRHETVRNVYTCDLPDVHFVVYNPEWKIHQRNEQLVKPPMGLARAVAAVLDDDTAADGVGVVPA
jgi:hypothetical protein